MLAYDCTEEALHAAARDAGLKLVRTNDKGNGLGFSLRLLDGSNGKSRYSKWSVDVFTGDVTRRSSVNVCIHGHYAFFKYLFHKNPKSSVVSTHFGYTRITRDGTLGHMHERELEEWYEYLRSLPINMIQTATLGELCACERTPH